MTQGTENILFCSHGDHSLTMSPLSVVAPSGSLTTVPTISLPAPRQSLTSWKTLALAGACIKRICLTLASRQIILTKRLAQMTTCASTSESSLPIQKLCRSTQSLTSRFTSPLMSYNSVTSNTDRLAKSKNFTMFYEDLNNNELPQWMFITPNMSTCFHCKKPLNLD